MTTDNKNQYEYTYRVWLYLKRTEQDAQGLCPLMGRITVNGPQKSMVAFGCKMKVNPDLWNSSSQRCDGRTRASVTANRQIESMLLLILARFNELRNQRGPITAEKIKNAYQGLSDSQNKLLELFREHNEEYALRVGVNRTLGTFDKYRNTHRLLTEFILYKYKSSDVVIKSLTPVFVESFHAYLRDQENHQPETILGHINRLRKIIHIAISRGIIEINPFEDFILEKSPPKQRYLSEKEFDRLMKTTLDTPARNFIKDVFLFASFTGLTYADLHKLKETDLQIDSDGNIWIEIRRQKTGAVTCVQLLTPAVTILEKYRGPIGADRIFPIPSNRAVNIHLKDIAKQCGITRNLSLHVARHTFASLICLQNGMPLETIKWILGHKETRITQRYAIVTDEKLDRDTTAWQNKIAGKYTLRGINNPPSTILRSRKKKKPQNPE